MHKIRIAASLAAIVAYSLSVTASDIPVSAFAQLQKLTDVELSHDGTHIAYLAPIKGREHMVLQPIGGGDPAVIPPLSEMYFNWVRWANSERLVFSVGFNSERDNVETYESRLGSILKDGSDLRWIIRSADKVTRGIQAPRAGGGRQVGLPQIQDRIIDWLPDEPNYILAAIDEDSDTEVEARKLNVNDGSYKNIRTGMRGIQHWKTDAQHTVRMGWGFYKSEFTVRILDESGQWVKAHRAQWWEDGFRPVAFTEDPSQMYVIGPNDNGVEVIRKLNPFDGSFGETVFEHDEFDANGVIFDSYSGNPIGYSWSGTDSSFKYFDATYDLMQRSLEKVHPGKSVKLLSMSADRQKVLVKVTAHNDPGMFYFWDRQSKALDPIAEVMPGIDPAKMSAAKEVSYTARDGTKIPAFLTVPLGVEGKQLPTVVLPHGGPASRATGSFYYLRNFLVSRGYAVLEPNFRGSTGYGKAFRMAGKSQWGGLMQDDVTDGAKWLVESGVADADRMCIVGWSYGGYSAAMGAIKTPDLFQCAASINGVLDLPRVISDDKKYIGGSSWVKDIGLDGEKSKTVSPYHQAERIKIPMLIVQAKDDLRVKPHQATRMVKRLRKLKKPVELVMVDFGGHSMETQQARETVLTSLEQFLASHIGT